MCLRADDMTAAELFGVGGDRTMEFAGPCIAGHSGVARPFCFGWCNRYANEKPQSCQFPKLYPTDGETDLIGLVIFSKEVGSAVHSMHFLMR